MNRIAIVGAGLVGSLLSVFLTRRGYKVTIFERRPDMRKTSISAGRSINLALSDRGWRALKKVGIESEIQKVAIPMKGRAIHTVGKPMFFQPYGKENQAIYSVSRGGLNQTLMNIAEKKGAEILFNKRCSGIDLEKGSLEIENEDGSISRYSDFDRIFATDGAFSAARLEMQMTDRFNYSQYYIEHGYKELTIPAINGTWGIEKNALHIWPREQYMLIALPNEDGSFTCTLFFPFSGEFSFESLKTEKEVESFFQNVFPDAFALMPTLVKDFFSNPTGSLVTVKCFPWNYKDKVLLMGDAAHAIVPFFGQGMNCGFEDCFVLDELLETHGSDFKTIFTEFGNKRKKETDAIAELALDNFIEMRDKVADPKFLLRKKIEARFNSKYPDKWIPLYTMVTFTELPYSYALEYGKKQDRIMEKVMRLKNVEEKWDSEEVERLMLENLEIMN